MPDLPLGHNNNPTNSGRRTSPLIRTTSRLTIFTADKNIGTMNKSQLQCVATVSWTSGSQQFCLPFGCLALMFSASLYALSFSSQPISQIASTGETVSLSASVDLPSQCRFQWYFNKSTLANQTNTVLILENCQANNAGEYCLFATDSHEAATSAIARLVVGLPTEIPPPIETATVSNSTINIGWSSLHSGYCLEKTVSLTHPAWELMSVTPFANSYLQYVSTLMSSQEAYFRLTAGPNITDFWSGRATWRKDAVSIGASLGFHFPSIIRDADYYCAYYIHVILVGNQYRWVTSQARSRDGVIWNGNGIVLPIGTASTNMFQSESSSFHHTGQAEVDGWSANVTSNDAGWLVYGPYTRSIPTGVSTVTYRMMIDNTNGANDLLGTIDIYDSTANTLPASKQIFRSHFASNLIYQDFTISYLSSIGHTTEFRTYWNDKSYLKQDRVRVVTTAWDDRLSSFPGIWKDRHTFYLVYEGAALDSNYPGDIGLATSIDGTNFVRHGAPILRHETTGWERANIGTPSLYKENGLWYLFYHGYDGSKCQDGVATGRSLTNLVKYQGNPIIPVGTTGWDCGTIGKRSAIVKENNMYFMAYEGSTAAPYDTASWSTGLACSTNLLQWTKYSNNPVIHQTPSGFGNDGPELLRVGGSWYLYGRVGTAGESPTVRYQLISKQ